MFSLVLLLAITAADPAPMIVDDQLLAIRECIEAVQKLERFGIPVKDEPAHLLSVASTVSGGKIATYEQLVAVTGGSTPPPTPEGRAAGFFTFVNIVWVSAAILGVVAIVWLFGIYLLELVLLVPLRAWEVICYVVCGLLIALGAKISNPDMVLAPVLPGAIGLIGCMALTFHIHVPKPNENTYRLASALLTIIWGAIAIAYGSHVLGFMAVMGLLTSLGFMMGVVPGVVYVGFDSEDPIPRTTLASGLIMLLWVALQITGQTDPRIDLFRAGMMVCGTFVYFIALLIWSSKWCCRGNPLKYLLLQVLMIGSGVAAIYVGSVFHLGFLLGMGGTIFYLYLIEKYYEIPWEEEGWVWSLLGLAGILYGFAVFAKAHPTYFMFWQ